MNATQELLTPKEQHAIYVTAQLTAYNQRLRFAIESKNKQALLRIYDDMESCTLNLDLAADPVLEDHENLVTIANDILYA